MFIQRVVRTLLPSWHKKARRPRESGQGLIEFVIVVPVLMLILAAITDLGILYIVSQTAEHASSEGARFAVKLDGLAPNDSRVSDYVDTYIPDINLYSGFTTGGISTTFPGCGGTDQVTVAVGGDYHFLVLNILGLNSIHLSFPTTMRYELCG